MFRLHTKIETKSPNPETTMGRYLGFVGEAEGLPRDKSLVDLQKFLLPKGIPNSAFIGHRYLQVELKAQVYVIIRHLKNFHLRVKIKQNSKRRWSNICVKT